MIHPRVLFLGDPAAAAPYVGIAKKLARETFAARIRSKVYRLGEAAIRIENTFPVNNAFGQGFEQLFGGISKVWIQAGAEDCYYQYIVTGSEFTQGGNFGDHAQGSAVAVKLPRVVAGTPAVLTGLSPRATGSSLESRPGHPDIQPASELGLLTRVQQVNQVSLITEPVYHYYADLTKPDRYMQLLYSWASRPGMIFNAGAFMMAPWKGLRDIGYDAPPTIIRGQSVAERMPDADWPHDACLVKVESETYGARTFIVMVDASSRFYCWPTQYDSNVWVENPTYTAQSYKNNVPDAQVRSLVPPFPDWVYVPVDQRRDTDWPGSVISGEPRYVWRFHPQGTKVVGIVLKREVFTGRMWGKTKDYIAVLKFTEVDTGEDLTLDLSNRNINYQGVPKSDWPGYVEFSLNITLTGVNKEDFTFNMTLTRQQAASATRYPIAADYLQPIQGGWAARGISGNAGDLMVMDLQSYIDARSQTWIARHCGYKGTTSEKVRQSWLSVRNEETDTELMKFLTKDLPTDFQYKQYHLDCADLRAYHGRLSHIDLANLSFVYESWVEKNDVDATSYKTVPESTIYSVVYPSFKVQQRWKQQQNGIRQYVFGKKIKEESYGEDLALWDTIDAIELFDDPIQFSPLETGTRWLLTIGTYNYVSGSYGSSPHWLLSTLADSGKHNIVVERSEPFNYYNPLNTSGIVNPTNLTDVRYSLLRYLSNLSENETGDSFYKYRSYGIDYEIVGTALAAPELGSPVYTLDVSAYTGVAYEQYTQTDFKTDAKTVLVSGCATADSDYFEDVLVPWYSEMYQEYLNEINITKITEGSTSIGVVLGNPTGESRDGYPLYWNENKTVAELTYTVNEISLTVKSGYYPGYYPSEFFVPFYKLHTRNCNYTYSKEDEFRATYNTVTHPDLRVYDYPIGAEWMMREWDEAIFNDMNRHLAVSPEGYYATALQTPFFTGSIPNGSVFTTYVKVGGTYYSYEKDLVTIGPKFAIDGAVKTKPSVSTYSVADHAFSAVNQPSPSSFDFWVIDEIGHVDSSSKTSHAALYATAYEHALSIPKPTVTVTYPDDIYTYSKVITYSEGSETSPLFINKPSIYAPFPNGSMLFSK